jgi:hypothetical protein
VAGKRQKYKNAARSIDSEENLSYKYFRKKNHLAISIGRRVEMLVKDVLIN